jgi:hypothetical protein
MKKLLTTLILIICIFFTYNLFIEKTENQKVQEKYLEYQKKHPFYKTLQLSKEERKARQITPNKYFEEKYLLEMNPHTGRTHPENISNVKEALKAMRLNRKSPGDGSDSDWEERGPNNVGGRTRALLFDPNDATHKRVFAGGASGGLWVNDDITLETSSWTQVAIDENLAISCIVVDPNNSQIMYLGTGESYANPTSVGNGVWKSINGGATWTNVYSDNLNADIAERLFYINDIVAWNNPSTNSTEVFIGIAGAYYGNSQFVGTKKHGLYKSTDDGASWARVNLPEIPEADPGTNYAIYEPNNLEIDKDNEIWMSTESNIFGYGGGSVLNSTDGATFTLKHTVPNGKRTEIAISKTDADKIYILAQLTGTNPIGMYLTTDGFATPATTLALPNDADDGIPANDFTRGQAGYDLMLAIDPINDAIAYIGGIDLFRTADSGAAWSQISKWSNNNNLANLTIPTVHADQHGWVFHPTDPNIAVNGNDGGVYYASDLSGASSSTAAFSARNKDYNVTQFYHGAIGQSTSTAYLLAGAQDNGTQLINGASSGINSTIEVYGGDGASSFIDKEGAYMTVSYVHNVIKRLNLPYDGTGVTISNDESTGRFINPQDLDDNLDILYTNGTSKLFKFSNITTDTPVKTEIDGGSLSTNITAIKVSPYTTGSSKVFIGTSIGTLAKVENANTGNLTITNISGGSFSGSISSIEFGASENEILVTFHNFGVTSIWYTLDGGANWSSKEGDFPDIPVKAILMNPLNNDEVIIGTELGVWKTSNFKAATPTWVASNNGMSNVPVTSFDLRTIDNTILATTYGRGMFTGTFTDTAATCRAPLALTATSITETTANIGWTEGGTATIWDIEWGAGGFTATGAPTITGKTTNTHSLSGLTRGTVYNFYIRANCGGGDLSTWSGPYTFTTPQVSTFPFTETFEDASATRSYWTQVKEITVAQPSDWTYDAGSDYGSITSAHGGSKNARFVSLPYIGGPVTWLISPLLDLSSLTAPQLKFYYGQEAWGADQNETKVHYSADSGATWTEIAHYTASVSSWTAVTLALTNKSDTYMIAFEGINSYGYTNVIDDVVIEESASTWTGTTDIDWNTASNWSLNSLPLTTDDIIIPSGLTNYPTATSAITFNSLTINSGASLIAQSSVNGNVTYNLAIPDTNWHLVSSPVVGETYDDAWIAANAIASGTGNNRGISTYNNGTPDATTKYWRYFQTGAAAANFNAGIGYSNKRTSTGTYSFTGTFPTMAVSPAIFQNDKNYNLIGNPYPSYLDIAAFITANTANMTPTHHAVYIWNGAAYTSLTTGYIHPGQGFFINSDVASGTASITEAMQSHNIGSFYRTNNPTINLTLSNGVSSKETTINYLEGKTIGLDPRFDIGMFKGVASDLSVFTHLIEGYQEVAFETQALPNTDLESMIVTVGVKANANEEITFSLNALNFPSDIKIFLEDSLTNAYTRLDQENSTYKITTTEALNGIGRFYLHTSRNSLSVNEVVGLENVSMYKTDARTLRITGLQNNSKTNVTLFDLTGKQVLNASFKSNGVKDIAIPKLATGVYVVKLKTDTGMFSKKIILE